MSRIIATSAYLPGGPVSNDQLIERYQLDSSDEWIVQRTGIKQRYFTDQSVGYVASQAAKALLEAHPQVEVSQIKHIIVATMSSKGEAPSVASQVQGAIGATNAWGVDVNGACSGFIMALELANKLSAPEREGYTLVIGAEKMSQILDLTDRSTAVLFGDGAGAVLIQHDGEPLLHSISKVATQADELGAITVDGDPTIMQMQGRYVFNFVKRTVIQSLADFITQHHLDYDYLICHQANARLLQLFADKLDLTPEQVPANVERVANTSGASIPILIHDLVEAGKLRLDGSQSVILCGFGAGLAWGQIYLSL